MGRARRRQSAGHRVDGPCLPTPHPAPPRRSRHVRTSVPPPLHGPLLSPVPTLSPTPTRCMHRCASPGSKTTQALEALYAHSNTLPDGDGSRGEGTGGVPAGAGGGGFMVANDMVPARCQMLLRRVAALGEMAERLVVTCHPAQVNELAPPPSPFPCPRPSPRPMRMSIRA